MSRGKLAFVFSDYDGTLAPIDASRSDSRIPTSLNSALVNLSNDARLAIITSKAFDFVFPRISYADAWACISGLDIRFRDFGVVAAEDTHDLEPVLGKARTMFQNDVEYEEKRDSSNKLLGFSVDWRRGRIPANLEDALASLSREGCYVTYDPDNPFFDAFSAPPDKRAAIVRIRDVLKDEGEAIFLGDSPADNDAFSEVDLSIGINHGQPVAALDCEFLIGQADLAKFLAALTENGMVFSADLPGIRRK